MTTDNKTLADAQPGGRVRLGDRPKDGEVLVEVSGLTGSGKSAIAGEIEILCKALGLEVEWVNGDEEKRLTHADWIGALEMYKPRVVIVEQNIPRAALSAQPSPGISEVGGVISAAISLIRAAEEFETADGLVNAAQLHLWHALEDAIEKVGPAEIMNYAQPSPGGQGMRAREFLAASLASAGRKKGAEAVLAGDLYADTRIALRAIEAALSARQPVGEPVGYFDPDVLAHLTEGLIDPVGVLRRKPNGKSNVPVWLGPPAQAVDLGRIINQIAEQWDGCCYDAVGETIDVGQAIRAAGKQLIDSQAVGK